MSLPKAIASGPAAATPDAVNPVRVAIGAGVLAALYLLVLYVVTPVPFSLVGLFGGARTDLERSGGLEMVWLPPAGMSEGEVVARFQVGDDRTQVRRDRDAFVISVPRIRKADVAEAAARLSGEGGLEFHRVLRVEEMKQLPSLLGLPMRGEPIDIDVDQWRPDEGGESRTDYYLIGRTREAVEQQLSIAHDKGWQLPPGTRIAVEHFDTETSSAWRTYVIDERAELDGGDIANAVGSYDPNTNRPIVLLDFTREGGRKFGDLTAEIVGEKLATMLDGEIKSAPIINGAIRGGRASITMGGTDPRKQEQERDDLVATLRAGALPKGGQVLGSRYVEPSDDVPQQWLARGAIALGGGALIALLVWMVVRITRPVRRRPIAGAGAAFPWSRVFVTLLAPVALYVVSNIFVFGIQTEELEFVISTPFRAMDTEYFSFGALGIGPIINAFIFVEILAVIFPGWRRRRHAGPDARAPITAAVVITAGTLLFVQGWLVTQFLYRLSMGGAELLPPGLVPQLLVVGSLMVGTLVLVGVAAVIREHGLGNGYGVLLATSWLIKIAAAWHWDGTVSNRDLVVTIVSGLAIAIPLATVARWRIARLGEAPLRLPASGIAPLGEVGGLVLLAGLLATFQLEELSVRIYNWTLPARAHQPVLIALVVALTLLWSFAFARPNVVRKLAERVGIVAPSRAAWWSATGLSAAVLLLVGAVALFTTRLYQSSVSFTDAMIFAVIAMVVLDIRDDLRARRVTLERVWSLHQAQHADLVVRALDDLAIPCHLASANLRTLLAFFGPFAPIDVWVAPEHVPAARVRLRELFE
jgi:hypothetical protein